MDRERVAIRLRWLGALVVLVCVTWVGGANWPHA
jgi:hypothetical protein